MFLQFKYTVPNSQVYCWMIPGYFMPHTMQRAPGTIPRGSTSSLGTAGTRGTIVWVIQVTGSTAAQSPNRPVDMEGALPHCDMLASSTSTEARRAFDTPSHPPST